MKGLREHLLKCEIEYIAAQGGGVIPDVKNGGILTSDIERYLKSIGFRAKERFTTDGEEWLRLYGGVEVSLKDGFCYKYKK